MILKPDCLHQPYHPEQKFVHVLIAIEIYQRLMRRLVKQTGENQQRGIMSFQNNGELQAFLDKSVMKMGLNMMLQSRLNKLRSAEKQVMIP